MGLDIKRIIKETNNYNFHSHTQFCDGRDTMEEIAAAAFREGMLWFGFSPHSPVTVNSPCNMDANDVGDYLAEVRRLQRLYEGRMEVMASMEIDYLGDAWGPHSGYFDDLPLDYRIGSVHFVPTQGGELVDCDGSYSRFQPLLKGEFHNDIRYIVEKYFEQVLRMAEKGGFDILGHCDKIIGNAVQASPGIDGEGWYTALMEDVVSAAASKRLVVEINTKAYADSGRFYPDPLWWGKFLKAGVPLVIDSDVHFASKVSSGRAEALEIFGRLENNS